MTDPQSSRNGETFALKFAGYAGHPMYEAICKLEAQLSEAIQATRLQEMSASETGEKHVHAQNPQKWGYCLHCDQRIEASALPHKHGGRPMTLQECADAEQPSSTATITDDDIVRTIRDCRPSDADWRALTYESGPYSITTPRPFLKRVVEALLARSARGATELIDFYEGILTEMRTVARGVPLVKEWVDRIDTARDQAARDGVRGVPTDGKANG